MYLYTDRVYNHKIDDYINSTSIKQLYPCVTSEIHIKKLIGKGLGGQKSFSKKLLHYLAMI